MSPLETILGSLPVSTLAQGMLQDALKYHSSKTDDSAAASNDVPVYNNAAIRRLAEVRMYV